MEGVGLHDLEAPSELYTGNSGTTTRLLCGILAGQAVHRYHEAATVHPEAPDGPRDANLAA